MSRFRIASIVVTRWDEKAGLRGDAKGTHETLTKLVVLDRATRSVHVP